MKKRKTVIVMLLVVCAIFGAGYAVGAATAEPGSNGDPLVSKSYLENRMADVEKQAGLQSVTLSKGKQLVCSKGAQLVVVSGAAKATGSLSDVTDGKKVAKNKAVANDHSVIVVKDKTGVKASKSAVVFVAGSYTVK